MKTLLLIDDDPVMTEAAREILEMLDTPALIAHDGHEGIRLFAANRQEIGLVVLDFIMPGISGEETLQRLREIDPTVPVLMSSGYDTRSLAVTYGVGSMRKPYGIKQLEQVVSKYLAD
jgi:DNA-binding response OmpR family regulator